MSRVPGINFLYVIVIKYVPQLGENAHASRHVHQPSRGLLREHEMLSSYGFHTNGVVILTHLVNRL